MEFGEKLRQAREDRGMTQQKLADKLFVTRQAVSRWECGARYPDLLTAKCISSILNVSMDSLLSGDEFQAYSEKQPVIESGKAGKIQTLLYATLCSLLLPKLAQGILAVIVSAAGGSVLSDANIYLISKELVFNGVLLCLCVFGAIKSFSCDATPRIAGLIGSIFYLVNGIHHLVMPTIAGYQYSGLGTILPLLLVSGFQFFYASVIWRFFSTGKAQLENMVCLFGLIHIAFTVINAVMNAAGLLRSGFLTQFYYVSADSLTSVTALCVITAITGYQARLLGRKRRQQQTITHS